MAAINFFDSQFDYYETAADLQALPTQKLLRKQAAQLQSVGLYLFNPDKTTATASTDLLADDKGGCWELADFSYLGLDEDSTLTNENVIDVNSLVDDIKPVANLVFIDEVSDAGATTSLSLTLPSFTLVAGDLAIVSVVSVTTASEILSSSVNVVGNTVDLEMSAAPGASDFNVTIYRPIA